MLGFPNRIDSATLSGGSWISTLPLNNLKNTTLGKLARSTNLMLTNTKMDIDLGKQQKIQMISAVSHNLAVDARYRLRGSNVNDFSAVEYDSGWVDVWSAVYPSATIDWEDSNWWSGKYTQEQIAGYTPTLTIILPMRVLARYWRLEFDDTANPAGYIQIGRVFIGPAWQPTINMSYGAGIGWETDTAVQKARSGAEYFDERNPYRAVQFTIDNLDQDEAFARAFEIFRSAGISKEVMFIHDPSDTNNSIRRQFLGRLRALSKIEYASFNLNKVGFEIKEWQ